MKSLQHSSISGNALPRPRASIRSSARSLAFSPCAYTQSYKDFDEILKVSGTTPVLVEFYASWCGPCAMEARELPRVQGAFGDQLKVMKINTEKYPLIASRFAVNALPTLMLFKEGRAIDKVEGFMDSQGLIQRIMYVLSKAPPRPNGPGAV